MGVRQALSIMLLFSFGQGCSPGGNTVTEPPDDVPPGEVPPLPALPPVCVPP